MVQRATLLLTELPDVQTTVFHDLIQRLRRGDCDAAQTLVDQYGGAIRREIRFSLLDSRLRRVVSESDLCQSVIAEFIVGLYAGKYEFESPESLGGLLRTIARCRVAAAARFWRSKKRDVRQQVDLGSQMARLPSMSNATPSQIVAHRELLSEVRRRLDPRDAKILQWRQQGKSWAEIAADVGDGSSAGAIRKRYERAINRLADDLGINGSSAR
jgi:RNA polymerase sigma factor (sigma-70 family)